MPETIRDEFIDVSGQIRRCVLRQEPISFRAAHPLADDKLKILTPDQLKDITSDPNRTPARTLFGIDWLLNQSHYSSCTGAGAAGATMRVRRKRGIKPEIAKTKLSLAYVYSKINNNQDDGAYLSAAFNAIQKWGIPPETLVTVDMIFARMQPKNADQVAAEIKDIDCYITQDIDVFRSGIGKGHLGVAALQAGRHYQTLDGDGVSGVDAGPGNHCIGIQDLRWHNGRWEYDHHGSWGPAVFDHGCSWLPEQTFADPIKSTSFYLLMASEEKAFE